MLSPDSIGSYSNGHSSTLPLLHGRILVATSDPAIAEEFRVVLTQAGGEVSVVQEGRHVLEAVQAKMPELLFLDMGLCDQDNATLCQQIKSEEETRYLPIVILIGDGAQPETSLLSGADDFLRRPILPVELILRTKLLLRLGRLHQDLTDNNDELQAAYETARESEAKYHALIQDAQDALFLIAPATATILEANRRALELSGYGEYDLIGQPVVILCEKGTEGHWPEMVARVTVQGRASLEDSTLRCKNGEILPVEIQASLASHHLGEPLIQILMRDLRPIRQLAAEQGKADRLAAVVETAVTVNHEINNPLLVITSSVEILQQTLFEAESGVREKLERISEACQRIQRFTQQLTSVITPVSKEYLPGMKMLDIQQSVNAPEQ
jgi:PAS domain S-box-containing protein